MTCNRSDLVHHAPTWLHNGEVEWYLSDEDISDIEGIITAAEGGAMVYEGLAAKGLVSASLPTGVGLILGGVLLAYFGWIKWSNSGCGVIVNFYISNTGFSAVYIESQ